MSLAIASTRQPRQENLSAIRRQAKELKTDSQERHYAGALANISQKNLISLSGRRPPLAARTVRIRVGGGYNTWHAQAVQAQREAAAGARKKTKYLKHVKLQPSSEA